MLRREEIQSPVALALSRKASNVRDKGAISKLYEKLSRWSSFSVVPRDEPVLVADFSWPWETTSSLLQEVLTMKGTMKQGSWRLWQELRIWPLWPTLTAILSLLLNFSFYFSALLLQLPSPRKMTPILRAGTPSFPSHPPPPTYHFLQASLTSLLSFQCPLTTLFQNPSKSFF